MEEEIEDVSLPYISPEEWTARLRPIASMREVAAEAQRERDSEQQERQRRWQLREAERRAAEAEYYRKRAERRLKRFERQAEIDEQDRNRQERHNALEAEFKAAGNRARWVAIERAKGRTLRSIAVQMGLSRERVRSLQEAHERKARTSMRDFAISRSFGLGRPLDMGGPRDVWLDYGVSLDPRLDNMAPVRP